MHVRVSNITRVCIIDTLKNTLLYILYILTLIIVGNGIANLGSNRSCANAPGISMKPSLPPLQPQLWVNCKVNWVL